MCEFFVDTPYGKLKVYAKIEKDTPKDCPSVFVDWIHDIDGKEIADTLCCVEYNPSAYLLQTCVYQPGEDKPVKVIGHQTWDVCVLCKDDVRNIAKYLIEHLGEGQPSGSYKASPYHTIGRGKRCPQNEAKVAIHEFFDAGNPVFGVRLKNNINCEQSEFWTTDGRTVDALVEVLSAIEGELVSDNFVET